MPEFGETLEDIESEQGGYDPDAEVPFSTPDEELMNMDFYVPPKLGDDDKPVDVNQIEESTFRPIPKGEDQLLQIVKVTCSNVENNRPSPKLIGTDDKPVYVADDNGRPMLTNYMCYPITVVFCLKGHPSWQVADYFKLLPPGASPAQRKAFTQGVSDPAKVNDPQARGFEAKKAIQFLHRLGFAYDAATGELEPAAYSPKNWLKYEDGEPRMIKADIVPKKKPRVPLKDRDGNEIPFDSHATQVDMFSYRTAPREHHVSASQSLSHETATPQTAKKNGKKSKA